MEYTEKRPSRMAVKPPRLPPELGYFLSLDNICLLYTSDAADE